MRVCTVCSHDRRTEIETALVSGTPVRNIAAQFRLAASSLQRHKAHIGKGVQRAAARREEKRELNVLEEMERLRRLSLTLLSRMLEVEDFRGAVVAGKECREVLLAQGALLEKATQAQTQAAGERRLVFTDNRGCCHACGQPLAGDHDEVFGREVSAAIARAIGAAPSSQPVHEDGGESVEEDPEPESESAAPPEPPRPEPTEEPPVIPASVQPAQPRSGIMIVSVPRIFSLDKIL